MIVSDVLWDTSRAAIGVLTPIERWSAARRMSGDSPSYASRY